MAQSDAPVGLGVLRFVSELRVPVTVRTFGYEDGWAATHCQVGAISAMQAVVFDWLDRAVAEPSKLPLLDLGTTLEVMRAHWHNAELEDAVARLGAAI